tara:strand:+ start:77 stop:307 length:231 start_codon:yes stop_codon:yes gene_type:complete
MEIRNSKVFDNSSNLREDISLKIVTRFPRKWVLIDTETSQIYQGTESEEIGKCWDKLEDKIILKKLSQMIISKTKK